MKGILTSASYYVVGNPKVINAPLRLYGEQTTEFRVFCTDILFCDHKNASL